MMEHLAQPLSVGALADRVAMSPRNFARLFAQEVGTTPGRYLLRLRVEAARRLLEQTDGSIGQVATGAGFRSPDVLRRAFLRLLGTRPFAIASISARPPHERPSRRAGFPMRSPRSVETSRRRLASRPAGTGATRSVSGASTRSMSRMDGSPRVATIQSQRHRADVSR
jgi:AraC-like DNA-binding protein